MRISDWSSDVCSSDLHDHGSVPPDRYFPDRREQGQARLLATDGTTRRKVVVRGLRHDARTHRNTARWAQAHLWTFSLCGRRRASRRQIGRASVRDKVFQDVLISVVAVALKKKNNNRNTDD